MEKNQEKEEDQILQEVALNEKEIGHPTFGIFKLHIPTLKDQKLIDSLVRAEKKVLKMSFDEIPDPNNPEKIMKIPAYKSREMLRKEFKELGWWTDENEQELQEAAAEYTQRMMELELLGFESEEAIMDRLPEIQKDLEEVFKENLTDEIKQAIEEICRTEEPNKEAVNLLTENSPSTKTDDLLDEAGRLRLILNKLQDFLTAYTRYMAFQTEEAALFADSWQNQLDNIIRLVQLFVCVKNEDGSKVWEKFQALKEDENSERTNWLLTEYMYFSRGIPDETRERMGKYGFFSLPLDESESSGHLPEEATSNPDGDLKEEQPQDSTEVTATEAQ